LKTVYINIYGLAGQLVRSVNCGSGMNTLQAQQDVSDLNAGYYLVELVNGTNREVKPLIKQ
ncbi:MAG: T9SS type A sorting domain-containing protein, partial [Flavobacteriales bacterium]